MDTLSPISKERKTLPAVSKSPVSPYKQPLPNPKLTEAQKSAAKTATHNLSQSSWLDVSLPDISAIASPEGPGALRSPERDPAAKERKAVEVWMKTAESGHAESQNNLAISYYRGTGVPKDDRKAVLWWSQAAQQGYAEAQYNLATCMMNGYGTGKDEDSAVALFRAAADQDHPDAMCMIASFFTEGTHGVARSLDEAVALYKKAAEAGSEEAEYKLMVIDDLKTRESELNQLSTKISKINDGFIQLQLERAAHEEVTHAYKGAGFFLSNMKSEVPVRARIEMAQKAEKEIKHLRSELASRNKQLEETLAAKAAKEAEVQDLEGLVIQLEREKVKQDLEIQELGRAKEQLSKDKQKQRKQIEELLAESTELRTVAEWHKNQRVDALKQSLSAVVQTTIAEQNERERALRSEIQKLRARMNQAYDSGPLLPGVDLDSEEHASAFLKRIRKDMFIQEALLKEILASMRGDDFEEQIEFLREVMGQADISERFLASAVDQILDHTSESNEVNDEDALQLKHTLSRIMNSMGEIKTKSGYEVQKIKNENDKLRSQILEMTEKLGMLTAEGARLDESDQRMVEAVQKQVQAMEEQARENEALLAQAAAQGHIVEGVSENLAQVTEAVKLLQREVRRSSSAFPEQGESDLKILEELRRQHEENQELLRTGSNMRSESSPSRRRPSVAGSHFLPPQMNDAGGGGEGDRKSVV